MAAAKYLSELASVKIKIMAHPSCIYFHMTRATLFLSLVGLTVYKRAPWYLKKIKRNRPNRRNPTGRKAYNQRLHISSCLFYIFCFPFFFRRNFQVCLSHRCFGPTLFHSILRAYMHFRTLMANMFPVGRTHGKKTEKYKNKLFFLFLSKGSRIKKIHL